MPWHTAPANMAVTEGGSEGVSRGQGVRKGCPGGGGCD